jgi:hypothetical protein
MGTYVRHWQRWVQAGLGTRVEWGRAIYDPGRCAVGGVASGRIALACFFPRPLFGGTIQDLTPILPILRRTPTVRPTVARGTGGPPKPRLQCLRST